MSPYRTIPSNEEPILGSIPPAPLDKGGACLKSNLESN
ncbi:hypothetical protein MSj_01529 [Microcystis aeruginosa Sj]|uniref:Uncharacterized protein n=1 Tax=Microcystis aeruginosa Sj TaxID=1979544 RepID=A0A2Z6UPA5_MICAE|nr:hypothetical protein MSj_01529 [Microcystis aeruginosa Sj]